MNTEVDYTKDVCGACGEVLEMPADPTLRAEHDCPKDCYGWDALTEAGKKPAHPRPFGPSKNGSTYCKSGSIASGGERTYCTCDTCF